MKLENKVAIVTGAASGIGRAEARLFSSEGAVVVVADVDVDGLDDTAAMINEAGGTVLNLRVDVTDEQQVQGMVEQTVAAYGRVDVLANNAGIFITKCKVAEVSLSDFQSTFDTNVKGQFLCAKHCIPKMIDGGGGVIVSTASISALVGQKGTGVYNASKASALLLTRNIALDYAEHNIRANCICPGYVDDTKINREIFAQARADGDRWEEIMGFHPLGRVGMPEEIAKCALFLACEDSSFVTGAYLAVDGGLTAV